MTSDRREYEYIVSYNPSRLQVICADYGKEGEQALYLYKDEALPKFKNLSYGDIVLWNNSFWCSVTANTSKEAFDIFCEKMEEREKKLKNERESREAGKEG